jgi:3-oxoadipate enol-lactonase
MSETMAGAIPGAKLVVLPDASHLAAIEQPAAFARAVREFLAAL